MKISVMKNRVVVTVLMIITILISMGMSLTTSEACSVSDPLIGTWLPTDEKDAKSFAECIIFEENGTGIMDHYPMVWYSDGSKVHVTVDVAGPKVKDDLAYSFKNGDLIIAGMTYRRAGMVGTSTSSNERIVTDSFIPSAESFSNAYASSTLKNQGDHNYSAKNLLTDDSSCWVEGVSGDGIDEWIMLELPGERIVSGINLKNGYVGTRQQYENNGKIEEMLVEFSNGESYVFLLNVYSVDKRNTIQRFELPTPVATEYVRFKILKTQCGEKYQDTCLTFVEPF